MRVLKFRAWDKSKKQWIFHTNENPFHIIGEVTVFNMLGQYRLENFNDIEITQYTGLQDSKGKEIYEGDIIKIGAHYEGDYWEPERPEVVEFENGSYNLCSEDIYNYKIEVIGNIYENNI
jgi:uncharacterized phage protein (TIGR01671 family)